MIKKPDEAWCISYSANRMIPNFSNYHFGDVRLCNGETKYLFGQNRKLYENSIGQNQI